MVELSLVPAGKGVMDAAFTYSLMLTLNIKVGLIKSIKPMRIYAKYRSVLGKW